MSDEAQASPTFFERYLASQVAADDIDDFIDEWHQNAGTKEIFEFLGMTREEYALWLREPETLPKLALARQEKACQAKVLPK